MKYILIASLLSSAVYAAPLAQVQNQQQQQTGQTQQNNPNAPQPVTNKPTGQGAGIAGGQTPTSADLATAVANWMADTSMVSNFLNTGASIQNNVQFKQAATVAYNAEVDELNHKAIIDAANGNMPSVIAANSTLATGGSFQDVVTKLQIMSQQGMAAANNIDLINQNRCVNVLPNIDAYMASTGSSSQAVRPTACNQNGVQGGVQGAGPTQPGQPAGSPAAAFAAAQALAAGTGNGQVQNGAPTGATGQQTPQQGTANTGATGQQTPQQGAANTGATGQQTPQQGAANTGATGQQTPQQGAANTGATGPQTPPQGAANTGATGQQTPQQGAANTGATGQQTPQQGAAGQQQGAAQGQQAQGQQAQAYEPLNDNDREKGSKYGRWESKRIMG
ncbi:hypothetical protein PtrEW7m1_004014 [Pyrenophora tritici-repentis]|nr:hypothetical protein PtrEW7m1_004014 [Pyrenophora tritici-repentis]